MVSVVEIMSKGINESLVAEFKKVVEFGISDMDNPGSRFSLINIFQRSAVNMLRKYSMDIDSVYAHLIYTLFKYFRDDVSDIKYDYIHSVTKQALPLKFEAMYQEFRTYHLQIKPIQTGSYYSAPTPITYHLYRNPCIFPH